MSKSWLDTLKKWERIRDALHDTGTKFNGAHIWSDNVPRTLVKNRCGYCDNVGENTPRGEDSCKYCLLYPLFCSNDPDEDDPPIFHDIANLLDSMREGTVSPNSIVPLVDEMIVAIRTYPFGESIIELRRAPGTCCPEPSCDNIANPESCEGCGAACVSCKRKLHGP